MTKSIENNKRIAKNTLLLYIRMFFIMAVSLFTSRIILKTLGVEDFGIYNVVAGVVSMMGVLNGAMSSATTRYLTIEIGKGNMDALKKTFTVCFHTYILMGLIFFLLAETIGLWFINTHLIIPENRIIAANWVFQCSIFSVLNTLMVNPYNAVIIAHERMNIYAYVGILEVILKLAIVYALMISPIDRLIFYGILYLLTSIVVTMVYRIYCLRHFEECHMMKYSDKKLFKQLLTFSGWTLFGSVATMVKGQGLNILLNMFFNPSVNASRGIAYQVNTAITQFSNNFYTAVRPQVTKYYAQNDLVNMFKLVFRSSKMTYYLLLLISLPIVVEAPIIIDLWLGQRPEYVVEFLRLIIIISAIDAMAAPIMTTANATGKIALYQFLMGVITILNLPISYTFLKFGFSPIIVFEVSLVLTIVCFFTRLWIVKRLVMFPVWKYVKDVVFVIVIVTIFSSLIPVFVYNLLNQSFLNAIIVCFTCILSTMIFIYAIGLKRDERKFVLNFICKVMHIKR